MDGALVWLLIVACDGLNVIKNNATRIPGIKTSTAIADDVWDGGFGWKKLRDAFLSGNGGVDVDDDYGGDDEPSSTAPVTAPPAGKKTPAAAVQPPGDVTDVEDTDPHSDITEKPDTDTDTETSDESSGVSDVIPPKSLDLEPLVRRLLAAAATPGDKSLADKAMQSKRGGLRDWVGRCRLTVSKPC
jgi:hypothetical protein